MAQPPILSNLGETLKFPSLSCFGLVLPPLALPPLPHAVDHVGQQLLVVDLVILK